MRDGREAAMRRHPWVPESAEVAQERMDREACAITRPAPRDLLRVELAAKVREVREWDGWPHTRWMLKVLVSVLALWMIVMILGVTIAAGYVGQIAGGWPQ